MTTLADSYTLDQPLGVGGMGTVYIGTDVKTEERVAIKRLEGERIQLQPELAERFMREADALRALNHPNIVKSFGYFEQDGDHFIVMEYVPGSDLADLLVRQGKLPVQRAVEIGIGLADALTRAHYLRIVHRDLKPANVLLDSDGTPRLTDFGVAYWEQKGRVTGKGFTVGTPSYMPPEVLNGKNADPRGDLWALGVILFEMLAGKHPFYDGSINTLLVNVLMNPAPDLLALRPEVPDAMCDLIDRMLEKDPDARIGSARLAGAELEAILHALAEHDARATQITPSRFAVEPPPAGFRHNLPAQQTPFIGRDDEMRELQRLLEDPDVRLVTVLGPGGMGKTRLALATAGAITGGFGATVPLQFEHGVYLVELAPLTSAEPLLPTIANALGFKFTAEDDPKQQLLDYLREKHLLLIMDNFEHILDGAPLLADILQAAPNIKILTTSRERLSLMAETVYTLGGLTVSDGDLDDDALRENGAVKLFIQSAKRAQPSFEAGPSDIRIIAGICRKVDGLPLGIVLAAGWVQTLSVREISDELSRNLDILESDLRDVPERHRSLRAVFDYSWLTMSHEERELVMRLSVFRGGLSRRAAQAVANAGLRQLAGLVSKSLLRRDPDKGSYHMHELLRQYTGRKLAASGEADAVNALHSAYYLDALAEVKANLEGGAQIDSMQAIDDDIENIRAAWMYGASSGSAAKLERGLPTLNLYFEMRGQYGEGLALYEQTAAHLRTRFASPERDAALAHVLARAAALATHLHQRDKVDALIAESRALIGDSQTPARAALEFAQGFDHLTLKRGADSRPHFEAAANLYRQSGERWALARTLGEWSSSFWYRADAQTSDFDRAKELAEEALTIQRGLNDTYGMATTLLHLGTIASYSGDDLNDAQCTAQSLALFERVGNLYGVAHALNNIGIREMMMGDYPSSRQTLEKSLHIKREIGGLIPIVWSLFVLARLHYNEADFPASLARADEGLTMVAAGPHVEWELTLQLSRGQALIALGKPVDALAAFDRALVLARQIENQEDTAYALNRKGLAALHAGDLETARTCLTDAKSRASALGDVTTEAVSRMLLARAALQAGDHENAKSLHAPSAAYFADKDNWQLGYTSDGWQLTAWSVESLLLSAEIASARKDPSAESFLLEALNAAEHSFSPAHLRMILGAAAEFCAETKPVEAAQLAVMIADDPRAYAVARNRARAVLTRLTPPTDPLTSIEAAVEAAKVVLTSQFPPNF